jgi:AP-4 complex subunit mu-1
MGLIKYFFCLNSRGSPLIVRGFLTESSHAVVESFFSRLIRLPPPDPVFRVDDLNFAYIQQFQLYFVLVSEDSMSPAILLELLGRLVTVTADYAGRCSELLIQRNLALIYEVIDEILSFGCPQATDSSNLLHLVHNIAAGDNSLLSDIIDVFTAAMFDRPLAASAAERSSAPNEIFVIVRESLELDLNSKNQIPRCCATGRCLTKSFLQGLPSVAIQLAREMTFASRGIAQGLEIPYDDIVFAPFVQSHAFDSERAVSFAPPQGLATVFSYRTSRQLQPPFTIVPVLENEQTKVAVVRISIQSTYPPDQVASDFELRFQCPVEISNASCELPASVAEKQDGEYDAQLRQVVWRIKRFHGLSEFSARFRFIFDAGIPASAETLLGPLSVKFVLPDILISGARVTNILVSTAGTERPPQRWIRLETVSQCYTFNFI